MTLENRLYWTRFCYLDSWSKNSLKWITRHSGGDTGEMVFFSQTTVNRKGMGGKYQSILGKYTFGFLIFEN